MKHYCMISRTLALVLLLALLGVACSEGDALSLARSRGLEPAVADGGGSLACDYAAQGGKSATMTWTDAKHTYTVEGDPAAVSQLYVDALALGGWQSCVYTVRKRARVAYGASASVKCSTLDEYLQTMQETLGVTVTPAATAAPKKAASGKHNYIVNIESKKFHLPGCSAAEKISAANRKKVTATREDMIARGYSPCGICNP